MTVRVLERHIRRGERNFCGRCPVALAINEAIGSDRTGDWYVDGREVYYEAGHFPIPLPADVVQRIEDYDAGLRMEPFEFELDTESHLPEWVFELYPKLRMSLAFFGKRLAA